MAGADLEEQEEVEMGELWIGCHPPTVSAWMGCTCLPTPQTGVRQRDGVALPSVKPSQSSLGDGHCLLLTVCVPLLGLVHPLESYSCISPQLTGEHLSTGMGFLIFEHEVDTQEMFECVLMRAPECPGTRKASSVHVLLGLGRLFRMTPRGSW